MHLIPRQVGRCVEAIFEPVCPHFSWTGKTSVSKALRENQLGTAVITKGPCLSLFSSSPFQAEFPGAGVTGWRDGPDPLAVQVQRPDTHPCPAWWGWGWAAWVPLPTASFRVTQEEMLRAGFEAFFFLVETFKSNRCSAHGNQIPRFSGTFLKVGACCGVWLNFWE